ncbi:hypothetical protein CBR_g54038 [Chara braunii]|uniref:Cation/H+ exchanger transmembrane domain-containing protein n=1 Tax=Chara braunii TaxID=69332 RepID=A0A388MBU1_CHABU|nr:hypothetical protein CBR_g54038 [Chara braunii]|eukprot:GBG91942.1 hypothetical protein CBR_g54038 [Chara braunii]
MALNSVEERMICYCDPLEATSSTLSSVYAGENPLKTSIVLVLLAQISMSVLLSRGIHILLRPLKQPLLLSEAIAGILLGPSFFGRIKSFRDIFFPSWSIMTLGAVADIGIIFLVFLVGVHVDSSNLRNFARAIGLIALAGFLIPFATAAVTSFMVWEALGVVTTTQGELSFLIGISLSVSAFPFLSKILEERELLATTMGQLILPASALIDVAALWALSWTIMFLNNILQVNVLLFTLSSTVSFIIFKLTVVGPIIEEVGQRSRSLDSVPDLWIAFTLVSALGSSFISNLLDMPPMFGAFLFGLLVPEGTPLATAVTDKLETLILLFVPLFYLRIGLDFDIDTINSGPIFGVFLSTFIVTNISKVVSCGGVAMYLGFGKRRSLVLGVLMASRGLMQLIVTNTCFNAHLINPRTYSWLVLMGVVTDLCVSPIVGELYSEKDRVEQDLRYLRIYETVTTGKRDPLLDPFSHLHVLLWFDSLKVAPSMVTLMEMCKGSDLKGSHLKVHIAYLFSLSSACAKPSQLMAINADDIRTRMVRWKRVPLIYKAFGRTSEVKLQPSLSITTDDDMHWDILSVAEHKHADVIFLPYHTSGSGLPGLQAVDISKSNKVVLDVLRICPCNVAVSIAPMQNGSEEALKAVRGMLGDPEDDSMPAKYSVLVLFFGGPDDRVALGLAGRFFQHKRIDVHVIRFLPQQDTPGADDYFKASASLSALMDSEKTSLEKEKALREKSEKNEGTEAASPRRSSEKVLSLHRAELHMDQTALSFWCLHRSDNSQSVTDDTQSYRKKRGRMKVEMQTVHDPLAAAVVAAYEKDYDLVLVGRGHIKPPPIIAKAAANLRASNTRLILGKVASSLFSAAAKMTTVRERHILVVQKGEPKKSGRRSKTKTLSVSSSRGSLLGSILGSRLSAILSPTNHSSLPGVSEAPAAPPRTQRRSLDTVSEVIPEQFAMVSSPGLTTGTGGIEGSSAPTEPSASSPTNTEVDPMLLAML